ncbi:hypothetical protein CHELA1G11_50068 [Hyphomicrobiales bacterium]|nr:hypothetical protein CHELA1G11_50068 [Hyphomicrobiales bacterium]
MGNAALKLMVIGLLGVLNHRLRRYRFSLRRKSHRGLVIPVLAPLLVTRTPDRALHPN